MAGPYPNTRLISSLGFTLTEDDEQILLRQALDIQTLARMCTDDQKYVQHTVAMFWRDVFENGRHFLYVRRHSVIEHYGSIGQAVFNAEMSAVLE